MSEEEREIDWDTIPLEERKVVTKTLFQLLRKLNKQIGGSFDDLFVDAQDAPLSEALDPYINVRKGKYDKEKTRTIHEWLARNHFAFGQKHEPALFQFPRQSDWDVFLETYGQTGRLSALPLTKRMGMARRASSVRKDLTHLRLGQDYCLELHCGLLGFCVGFEHYNDTWKPLALGEDERRLRVQVKPGKELLPRDGKGQPIPLVEIDHGGLHRFVVVVVEDKSVLIDRLSLSKLDPDQTKFDVHMLDIYFAT